MTVLFFITGYVFLIFLPKKRKNFHIFYNVKERRLYMSQYIKIAKRENNNKRGFLIVNPYLGKHVPQKPREILGMFDKTALLFPEDWNPKQTLVIGFAETATALGLHYACKNNCRFIQTTREHVIGERIYFSEEHSHATEQYLLKEDLDTITHIMFVDDEITTGKTVLNAITAINRAYGREFQYGVTSIINSMTKEQQETYQKRGIEIHCLEQLPKQNFEQTAEQFKLNGHSDKVSYEHWKSVKVLDVPKLPDCRKMIDANYEELLKERLEPVLGNLDIVGTALVLGVEEFMYAGIWFGNQLENKGCNVRFHATTRSPIAVSEEETYPLHHRFCMNSVNASERNTFLYDVAMYDHVFVFVEKNYSTQVGMDELCKVIETSGNKKIYFISI